MAGRKKYKVLTIRVDEETYRKLLVKAEEEGYSMISDYILALINQAVRAETTPSYDKLKTRIKRYVQDVVNEQLMVVENLKRQVIELYDKIDGLEKRINDIDKKIQEISSKITRPTPIRRERPVRQRKTGIERLREEKVLFESRLTGLRYRDKFFSYLERMGAIVIPLRGERVAVDAEFWENFKKKLFEEIDTDNEEIIKEKLDPLEYQLFLRLRSEPLIFFDAKTKKWKPISESRIFSQ
ncbi:CopG family transcriptional regulator [Staphylothermus hellenicus]|uniref:CopG domain protein DNA-binding domain protein n=1 Tax=Staphylothermus hellenicus (strain DSM 12710 / JCM 10830 / BK20S6-10-b1 / P8) TaxID=591019 RepID=D7DBB5_STAHD|nr:CopG family transcriptional regulator [Staphylothermus hellenicus]ADI31462.1 hypothetical protein Shell_0330 [Staphylothermus hellenicus DSM 12710]